MSVCWRAVSGAPATKSQPAALTPSRTCSAFGSRGLRAPFLGNTPRRSPRTLPRLFSGSPRQSWAIKCHFLIKPGHHSPLLTSRYFSAAGGGVGGGTRGIPAASTFPLRPPHLPLDCLIQRLDRWVSSSGKEKGNVDLWILVLLEAQRAGRFLPHAHWVCDSPLLFALSFCHCF